MVKGKKKGKLSGGRHEEAGKGGEKRGLHAPKE